VLELCDALIIPLLKIILVTIGAHVSLERQNKPIMQIMQAWCLDLTFERFG
jgi:hypothetical protein